MRKLRGLLAAALTASLFAGPPASAQENPPPEPLILTLVSVQDEALIDMNQPPIWIASGIAPVCEGKAGKDEQTLELQTHQDDPLGQQTLAAALDLVAHCDSLSDNYALALASEADLIVGWDDYRAGKYAEADVAFLHARGIANNIWRLELSARDATLRNIRSNAAAVRVIDDNGPPDTGYPQLRRSQFFGFLDEMALVASYAGHWDDLCRQRLSPNLSLPKH